jgi:hypothetical protein
MGLQTRPLAIRAALFHCAVEIAGCVGNQACRRIGTVAPAGEAARARLSGRTTISANVSPSSGRIHLYRIHLRLIELVQVRPRCRRSNWSRQAQSRPQHGDLDWKTKPSDAIKAAENVAVAAHPPAAPGRHCRTRRGMWLRSLQRAGRMTRWWPGGSRGCP